MNVCYFAFIVICQILQFKVFLTCIRTGNSGLYIIATKAAVKLRVVQLRFQEEEKTEVLISRHSTCPSLGVLLR